MFGAINGKERVLLPALFLFCFVAYCCAPVIQITDSNYSMMMSQAIIEHGTVRLDEYDIPADSATVSKFVSYTGYPYQIEPIKDKLYYYFPHGSSVLSVPFVAIINALGFNSVNDDQTYNIHGESRIQRILSAALTATAVLVVYMVARVSLSSYQSLFVAVVTAFATSFFSTISRGMWSHTWLVLLLVIALFLIWKGVRDESEVNPILLATILSWMFFVRPTASISIIAISILVFIYFRRIFLVYAFTGTVWLIAFILYSKYHFDTLLPSYYASGRVGSGTMASALLGNLISPGRGLLIYSPFIIIGFVATPLLYKYIKHRALLYVAILATVLHLFLVSSFPHWWGGHSYGPRFMSDIIPWITMIMIVLLDTYYKVHGGKVDNKTNSSLHSKLIPIAVLLLVSLSISIHARGAYSDATAQWNIYPSNIDDNSERIWDWSHPQFLAGFNL